jgi:peroxiredoxin
MTAVAIGDPAPDGALLDLVGKRSWLSTSWAERPAVVVFLRYFGCPLCQAQVVGLRDDGDRFDQMGGDVILVGQGTPQDAASFLSRKRAPFPCLIDPDRSLYRAYGLARGSFGDVFGPDAVFSSVRQSLHRETIHGTLHGGNLMQMPGTFIVDRHGVLRFVHRSRTIADTPPNRVLLDVLDRLRSGAEPGDDDPRGPTATDSSGTGPQLRLDLPPMRRARGA